MARITHVLLALAFASAAFMPSGSAADEEPVITVPVAPTEGRLDAYNFVWKAPAGTEARIVRWDFGDGTTRYGTSPDFDVRHKFADDGTYTVRVRATLSDGSTLTAAESVTVANVAPTAWFQPDVGDEVILAVQGESIRVPVRLTDPGADDVTITWPDGSTMFHASDGAHPRNLDEVHAVGRMDEGVTRGAISVRDDDGGESATPVTFAVRGTSSCDLGRGAWVNAFRGKDTGTLTQEEARAYGDVVRATSTAFQEVTGLGMESDIAEAKDTKRDRAKATMLLAWLTFASGAGELEPLQQMDAALASGHPKAAAKMARQYLESVPDCAA